MIYPESCSPVSAQAEVAHTTVRGRGSGYLNKCGLSWAHRNKLTRHDDGALNRCDFSCAVDALCSELQAAADRRFSSRTTAP
jgi:hypothetical protein